LDFIYFFQIFSIFINMKRCTKCEENLSIDKFPIMNKKTGKISSMCLDCKREYDREYWKNNKEAKGEIKNEHAKKNRITKRKYIIELLKNSKCVDCGNSDWRVLEFDHRNRETKSFNIADAVSYSIENIQKEIDKCDIVCANCHNIRTIEQRGYYKF
jgi:hypothetical protein